MTKQDSHSSDPLQEQEAFLDRYESQLTDTLLRLCTSAEALSGQLLETPDLEEPWKDIASEYLVDAIPEIADYPLVALGWAMYIGMAMAQRWDEDWNEALRTPSHYAWLRDARGFDAMDEHIREAVLHLSPSEPAYAHCEKLVQRCAQQSLTLIRREQIEAQSPLAFHCFVRSIHALYRIGIAVQLHTLGYKFEKQ